MTKQMINNFLAYYILPKVMVVSTPILWRGNLTCSRLWV